MRLPIAQLRARYDVLAGELAKFGTVGAIAFAVDLSLLNLLSVGLGYPELRSKVAASVVATCVAFGLNRHWTFRHREQRGLGRESALFFGLNAVGLALSLLVIGGITYGLSLRGPLALNLANVVGTGLGTMFRFWSYRRFVWLHPEQVAAAAEDGDVAAAIAADLAADLAHEDAHEDAQAAHEAAHTADTTGTAGLAVERRRAGG